MSVCTVFIAIHIARKLEVCLYLDTCYSWHTSGTLANKYNIYFFIYLFICLLIYSFIQLFIYSLTYLLSCLLLTNLFISLICPSLYALTLSFPHFSDCGKICLPKCSAPCWSNPSFLIVWHSGTLALRSERQSARMSKIKNGRLDRYGAGPFE